MKCVYMEGNACIMVYCSGYIVYIYSIADDIIIHNYCIVDDIILGRDLQ